MFRRGFRRRAFRKFPLLRGEAAARDEISLLYRVALHSHRIALSAALLSEANNIERFLDVQFARPAVRGAPVVIVLSVGKVRLLLNLAEHEPWPYGVRRAGGNEDGVACLQRRVL